MTESENLTWLTLFICMGIIGIFWLIKQLYISKRKRDQAFIESPELKKMKPINISEYKSLRMREINEWEKASINKDFSPLIQYYKKNNDIILAYLKRAGSRFWTDDKYIYEANINQFDERKKLANLLFKGSKTLDINYFNSALQMIYSQKKTSLSEEDLFWNNCLSSLKSGFTLSYNLLLELDDKVLKISKNLYNYIKEQIFEIETFSRYLNYVKLFLSDFKKENYNSAFNNFSKAEFERIKIKNKNIFLGEKEEQDFKSAFKIVVLNLTAKIKKKVLDLGTKFTRLEMREISEKCNIDNEDLIIKVVEDMIKNEEIYAEYFKSTKAVAFNQQANMEEIDNLMATFKEWEEKEVGKK